VAQFKRGEFSTCDAPRLGLPKTVTTPVIIDQILELILECRRISAKSITEQLYISRERVGTIIHEDLDMRNLSAKLVPKCPNADQKRQRCQSSEQLLDLFRRDPNDVLSRRDWWPWKKNGYITMTRRQSNNQWSGGVAAHPTPKNSECKNPLENFSPRFFGIKTHPPSLLSSKGPNYQREVLLISAGAIEGYFEGKTPREVTMVVLFLHDKFPANRVLETEKKLVYLGFQCLDHPPYSPDLASPDYNLFPGLKKTIESSPFFVRSRGHSCRGDLVGRTIF